MTVGMPNPCLICEIQPIRDLLVARLPVTLERRQQIQAKINALVTTYPFAIDKKNKQSLSDASVVATKLMESEDLQVQFGHLQSIENTLSKVQFMVGDQSSIHGEFRKVYAKKDLASKMLREARTHIHLDLICENVADHAAQSRSLNLLGSAASRCDSAEVEWLVKHGCEVNFTLSSVVFMFINYPPVLLAASAKNVALPKKQAVVDMLLKKEANPLLRTISGWWLTAMKLDHVRTVTFFQLMDSVQDMKAAAESDGKSLHSSVLDEFIAKGSSKKLSTSDERVGKLMQILIFHGVPMPSDVLVEQLPKGQINERWTWVRKLDKAFQGTLLKAPARYERQRKIFKQAPQDLRILASGFPKDLLMLVLDYAERGYLLNRDEHAYRCALAHACYDSAEAESKARSEKQPTVGSTKKNGVHAHKAHETPFTLTKGTAISKVES